MLQIENLQKQADKYRKEGRMMLYNHVVMIINQLKYNLK